MSAYSTRGASQGAALRGMESSLLTGTDGTAGQAGVKLSQEYRDGHSARLRRALAALRGRDSRTSRHDQHGERRGREKEDDLANLVTLKAVLLAPGSSLAVFLLDPLPVWAGVLVVVDLAVFWRILGRIRMERRYLSHGFLRAVNVHL